MTSIEDFIDRPIKKKKKRLAKNEFIDDEAQLSSEDEDKVSEDEIEDSDDDQIDPDLVDKDAPELDSDQEEEIRGFYHKQLEKDDRRTLLLLREQLEEKDVGIGQRRRRKFRWQTKQLMDDSLKRHYDPDDDDTQSTDDDSDYEDLAPRLRRPTAELLLMESAHRVASRSNDSSDKLPTVDLPTGEESSSNLIFANSNSSRAGPSNMTRFLYRDREVVQALSTRETVVTTREEKDKIIQRELKRVLQNRSVFDQLYT